MTNFQSNNQMVYSLREQVVRGIIGRDELVMMAVEATGIAAVKLSESFLTDGQLVDLIEIPDE